MPEDKGKRDSWDSISLEHEWERRTWTQWLHCDEQKLRRAVECAGADPDNVRRFLRQAR